MQREATGPHRRPIVRLWTMGRRLFAVLLLLGAGGIAAAMAWQQRGGEPAPPGVPLAAATRGDVVVTVGGVGRVVEARAVAPIGVPAAAGPATAPADAVFATAPGRVRRLLVAPGQHVRAGQRLALIDDGGATALSLRQARGDQALALVELAQRRATDPALGLPPTRAELSAADAAVRAARTRLTLLQHPASADVAAVRLDLRRAQSDLATLAHRPSHTATLAARDAVDAARRRLALARAPAAAADLTAARTDLKKAEADLEILTTAPRPPTASAIEAARLAIALAQQRIAELAPGAPASEVLAARFDLQKAQADYDALTAAPAPPTATAIEAAQLAVELARERLARLSAPPSSANVATARADLKKAQTDLKLLQQRPEPAAVRAARLAITLATRRLAQLLHPSAALQDTARAELAKAVADLETLRRRGAPASPRDITLARLKVRAAAERVAAALMQARRLVVRSPLAGTVTSVLTVAGAPVDATTPIATIADLKHLAVRVELSEFDAARVHRGQLALLRVDALGDRRLHGRVLFAALTGVDSGGIVTFPAVVRLPLVAGVRPGMNVSVRIVVAQRRDVVRIPLEAVTLAGRRRGSVSVVGPAGRTVRRTVVLGLSNNERVEVLRGLRAGEHVALAAGGEDA